MSHFTIPSPTPDGRPIRVTVKDGIELDEEALFRFKAFKYWLEEFTVKLNQSRNAFHSDPRILHEVKICHVTKFGPSQIGLMTIEAIVRRSSDPEKPISLDTVVFLREGSVAVLMILRPKDAKNEIYVIMIEQPRIEAGTLSSLEIPGGIMDNSNNITGEAVQKIMEETGFTIEAEELIDMTELASRSSENQGSVPPVTFLSHENIYEYFSILLWEKELERKEIEALKAKLTGLRAQNELITPRLCNYEVLWKERVRDKRSWCAWALYEGLNRSGQIGERLRDIRMGKFEGFRPT